jgi:serine/threonine-protein kinase
VSEVTQFGRYLLLKKIATGGMAELFLGKQVGIEGFEKPVVIKQILPHLSENEEFITMFLDEARVAARLNHPRVVQIYDLGKEGPSYFIAMEYVRGQDLRKIIKRAQSLREGVPLGVSLHILVGVLEGLDHAHRQTDPAGRPIHLVHRDVSPQNILVSYEGDVKLVDFGIAKASTQIYQTRAGILKGKYAYMSPEQAQGLAVDRRSDVFAVGILLYELTTGRRLFRQANEIETLKKVIECSVAPPSSVEPDYPRDLEEIALRALERDPGRRFQDAREMQVSLESFLRRHGILTSSARLAEYMHRLFAQEIGAAMDELRVLMEARPGEPLPTLPAAAAPAPDTSSPSPEEAATQVGSGSRRSAPQPEPAAAEKTLLLEPGDMVPLEGGTTGFSEHGETVILPQEAAVPPEELEMAAPDAARRRHVTLVAVTLGAMAIAALVILWRATREAPPIEPLPAAELSPVAGGAPPPPPLPKAAPARPTPLSPAPPRSVPPEAAVEEEEEKPARKRRKRRKKEAPPPGPAVLSVRTNPETQVYADGKLLGTTPLEVRHEAGALSLRLRNPALGIDYRMSARLTADSRSEVHKVFGKGRIKVSVEPWADVVLDGRALGETPIAPQTVYEGDHVLTLSNPRLGKKETVRVKVRAGETALVPRVWN